MTCFDHLTSSSLTGFIGFLPAHKWTGLIAICYQTSQSNSGYRLLCKMAFYAKTLKPSKDKNRKTLRSTWKWHQCHRASSFFEAPKPTPLSPAARFRRAVRSLGWNCRSPKLEDLKRSDRCKGWPNIGNSNGWRCKTQVFVSLRRFRQLLLSLLAQKFAFDTTTSATASGNTSTRSNTSSNTCTSLAWSDLGPFSVRGDPRVLAPWATTTTTTKAVPAAPPAPPAAERDWARVDRSLYASGWSSCLCCRWVRGLDKHRQTRNPSKAGKPKHH